MHVSMEDAVLLAERCQRQRWLKTAEQETSLYYGERGRAVEPKSPSP